jgi:hypothetical protein
VLDIKVTNLGDKQSELILKTDTNISTTKELQTSIDSNLNIINQTLVSLDTKVQTNTEDIVGNTETLATLSENINSLTELTTTLTDTVTNHEVRIAQLEELLVNQGIELDTNSTNPQIPELTNIPESLETLATNLTVIQEEDTDEEGNTVPKQVFSLSGDLIVERLKAQKIEAEEIEVAGIKTSRVSINSGKTDDTTESSVGSVVIPEGKKSVLVKSNIVENSSKIILTSRDEPVAVGVGKIKKQKSFEIKIANVLDDDLTVDWIIIGVDDIKDLSKK